ncbi:MAG: VOC family protein [Phycisphaerae bacterium]|nr:VOC family protein [Phycisphaerae bacterium]
MLRRLDRFVIRVESLPAAARFYREVMGLSLVHESPSVVTLKLPDDSSELVLHNDPDQPAEAAYWLVDDVSDLYRRREELRLTFLGPPQQASRGMRASVRDPFGTILHLLDRTTGHASKREDLRPAGQLFAGVESRVAPKRELLLKLYEKIGRTADDLPYTPHFEGIYEPYAAAHPDPKPSRAETWRHLLNLRKGGKLPKMGEARSRPPELEPEEIERLKRMVADDLGKRDRLPYTERFNMIVDRFNETLDRKLSPHHVWRLVATLAK